MQYVIGVDLGGTKTAAGVVSADGEVLFSETIPTLNRDGGEADPGRYGGAGGSARCSGRRRTGIAVGRVGVGSAGVIDAAAAEPSFPRPMRSWGGPGPG